MAINKVGSKGIEDGSVATADFAPGTVSSDKLQDNAVTNAKLTNTTVTLAGQSITLGASTSFTNRFTDWQSVITADGSTGTTAVSGRGYFIDTTSAAHTITLPASASIGDFIAIKDYAGTFATNNLTIARNGHNIQGVTNDSSISTNRASLVLVYVDSTKGWLYWEEHNVADLQAATFISATGGTVTESGNYKIHTFTGDGCFVVSSVGNPVTPVNQRDKVDYLVVAGGGAAGNSRYAGGGGGGGGFRESHNACASGCYTASPLATPTSLTITATTYPITVGAGGANAPGNPSMSNTGSPSIFSTITSASGGGGGCESSCTGIHYGFYGGSGGGGSSTGSCAKGGGSGNIPSVSPPQGNDGGAGDGQPGVARAGGGGGGATQAGTAAQVPGTQAGNGGNGATTSISGTPTAYSGGGGGGRCSPVDSRGLGGTGGGGNAGSCSLPNCSPEKNGVAGAVNTGGGGGGGSNGEGGKGIVIIRYKFQ